MDIQDLQERELKNYKNLKKQLIKAGEYIIKALRNIPRDEFGDLTIMIPMDILPPEKSVKDCTAEDIIRLRRKIEWVEKQIKEIGFAADQFRATGKTFQYRRAEYYLQGLFGLRKRDRTLLGELEERHALGLLGGKGERSEKREQEPKRLRAGGDGSQSKSPKEPEHERTWKVVERIKKERKLPTLEEAFPLAAKELGKTPGATRSSYFYHPHAKKRKQEEFEK